MLTPLFIMIILSVMIVPLSRVYSAGEAIFFRDDFNTLDNWKPLTFPKIKVHTKYTIEKEGDNSYLKAVSDASASGIVFQREFDVYTFPKVRWSWKVSNVFAKGDAEKKSGDDYPLRIYVIFKYDPEKASFLQRIKYGLVKQIYGEYPPRSSLNYIWANKHHKEQIITNTYASEAKMILLEEGAGNAGKWIEEKVNIIDDYRKAFGEDPPVVASLAIMSDSDNTGEKAVSYVDYIEVYR